jgi:hypothetical protein
MTTQVEIQSFSLCYSVDLLLSFKTLFDQPEGATSLDYGFDFDEQELGDELTAPLPANVLEQPAPLIEADEFDSLYKWFIS